MALSAQAKHHPLFPCLDGMRGIAALLIVVRHTTPLFGQISFQESYLAVDLFFLLSGVVIGNAYETKLKRGMSALAFMRLRIIRLYPLYAIGLALGLATASIRHEGLGWLAWHGSLSVLFIPNPDVSDSIFPVNGPTWSLFFEIVVNVLYAATLHVLVGRRLVLFVVAMAIGLIACVLLEQSPNLDLGWKIGTLAGGSFRVGFSFFAGVWLYRLHARRSVTGVRPAQRGNHVSWLLLACVAGILVSAPPAWAAPVVDLAAVFVVFPVLVYAALDQRPTGVSAALFAFGGLVSYAVYVLHEPAGILVGNVYHLVFRDSVSAAAPWIGIGFMPVLVLGCFVIDRGYDLPTRRFLLRRWQPTRDRAPPVRQA